MAYVKKYITPGTGRPEIDNILRCPWDIKSSQKAKIEYSDLLSTEHLFGEADPNKYRSIYEKNISFSIPSYTSFGKELKRNYPESTLVKMICDQYQTYGTCALREAMVHYNLLQEVSQAYSLMLQTRKSSQPGFSQTQYTQPPSSSHSTQHSRTVYDSNQAMTTTGQPLVCVDQPTEYRGQTYYPESMYKELIQHKTTQEKDIYRLQRELKERKEEVDDLRSRLSSFASKQLTEGNPDFTDLSDINRPDKMAERFHKIYDDEWTTSLESLTKGNIHLTEEKAISVLMDIIKSVYEFCTNYAEKQTKNMVTLWRKAVDDPFTSVYSVDVTLSSGSSANPSKAVVDEFKQHRKSFHKECIRIAIKNFKGNVITKNLQIENKWLPAVDAYVDVCVEVLWLMSVQNPPMALEWPEPGSKFDNEKYKEYCKKGKIVKLAVWPAVFLTDKGSLMNKGYAMPV